MKTAGLHHVTAFAKDPQENLRFYTEVLGLRLVKKTVNFDDPGTYHFYFGNQNGEPGTIITFFPFQGSGRGTVGKGQAGRIYFSVPKGSLFFWKTRLEKNGLQVTEQTLLSEQILLFHDTEDLPLAIMEEQKKRMDGRRYNKKRGNHRDERGFALFLRPRSDHSIFD